MPCILRFLGDHLDVTSLQATSPVEPCHYYRKGDPVSNRPNARTCITSGVHIVASSADFSDPWAQHDETLAFCRLHHSTLLEMRNAPGVERLQVDYGIEMRNDLLQEDSFSEELLQELASLRAYLTLSQYPPMARHTRAGKYRRIHRGRPWARSR